MLTFKKFLDIINEDANEDQMILQLQTQLNQVESQINQQTQRLLTQKTAIQRKLNPLLKKKQVSAKTMDQQNPEQQMQAGATTTPGSTGAATPGSQASTAQMRV